MGARSVCAGTRRTRFDQRCLRRGETRPVGLATRLRGWIDTAGGRYVLRTGATWSNEVDTTTELAPDSLAS